jgi:hypothetical protein
VNKHSHRYRSMTCFEWECSYKRADSRFVDSTSIECLSSMTLRRGTRPKLFDVRPKGRGRGRTVQVDPRLTQG